MTHPRKNYVGFGFGPIQSGLFLLEASLSGQFGSLTVAEIDPALVEQVNANHGTYTINVAHPWGIQTVTVQGVTMLNPRIARDRQALIEAIRRADELGTALPSVKFYAGDNASVVSLLAEALLHDLMPHPQLIYTAENDNHAAEKLTAQLEAHLPPANLTHIQALNTVIGKMSGVITDAQEIKQLGLTPLTPTSTKAVLVEAFNRILISKVTLAGTRHSIPVFSEKEDLMPFEEAKLYGHNAIHALIGYLAWARGLATMAQAARHDDLMRIARTAFHAEVGLALCRKHSRLNDALFTPEGMSAYADDLLTRMGNPYLHDRVERVIRDPQRKLGWNDRLFGAMRLCLEQNLSPENLAKGAAQGVCFLLGQKPATRPQLAQTLRALWGDQVEPDMSERLIELTWQALG